MNRCGIKTHGERINSKVMDASFKAFVYMCVCHYFIVTKKLSKEYHRIILAEVSTFV